MFYPTGLTLQAVEHPEQDPGNVPQFSSSDPSSQSGVPSHSGFTLLMHLLFLHLYVRSLQLVLEPTERGDRNSFMRVLASIKLNIHSPLNSGLTSSNCLTDVPLFHRQVAIFVCSLCKQIACGGFISISSLTTTASCHCGEQG